MAGNEILAIYMRLSREDPNMGDSSKRESNSITAQRRLIYSFIREHPELSGYIFQEFCDDGFSGTRFDRPEFVRMITAVNAGKIRGIIVKDFSRFGRDYLEVGNYLEHIFPALHVRFLSVNDGYDSYGEIFAARSMEAALRNLVYGIYSRDLSKKICSAQMTRVKNGQHISPFIRYGYRRSRDDRRHIEADPEAADTVRLIFQLAADGCTISEIVRRLNERQIPTCAEYKRSHGIPIYSSGGNIKKLWSTTTVRDILYDEIYLGKSIWKRRRSALGKKNATIPNDPACWIVTENAHEPLISQELFDRAHAHLPVVRQTKGQRGRRRVLFVCGKCGRALVYNSSSHRKMICAARRRMKDSECSRVTVETDFLEAAVLEQVHNRANELFIHMKQLYVPKARFEEELAKLGTQKTDLARRRSIAYEKYCRGEINRNDYEEESGKLARLAEEIQRKREQIKGALLLQEQEELEKKAEVLRHLRELQTCDRTLLLEIIRRVVVLPGNQIEIEWRAGYLGPEEA